VLQEQEVKRLKKELSFSQQALRENVAVIKQEADGPNVGLSLVDSTVKFTNKIQLEKRKLEMENAELKQKLERLQTSFKNGETEREKFFEGASWASRQCVQACDEGVAQAEKLRT